MAKQPGLDGRSRDENGQTRAKNGNTRIDTLQEPTVIASPPASVVMLIWIRCSTAAAATRCRNICVSRKNKPCAVSVGRDGDARAARSAAVARYSNPGPKPKFVIAVKTFWDYNND